MASNDIPETDHLVRYVSWNRLIKDEDNETVIGILPQAFVRREGEETLSVTWAEFHGRGDTRENIEEAARTIRNSRVTVGGKSAFAYANVDEVTRAAQEYSKKIRILHEQEDDNLAHVGIHRWPDEVSELIGRLASFEWCRFILNKNISR